MVVGVGVGVAVVIWVRSQRVQIWLAGWLASTLTCNGNLGDKVKR
jgi:hypothetical protein